MSGEARQRVDALLARLVSIDIEVTKDDERIRSFAGVRRDPVDSVVHEGGNLARGFERLDEFSGFADFVVGHNFIRFDLPRVRKAAPGLSLLEKPVIDTLWLNPLAFPRNPYHRLVKHYQDGALQGGHTSDPKLDAELVLTVLENQLGEFGEFHESDPGFCGVLHRLATARPGPDGFDPDGFDAVFRAARAGAEPPSADEAAESIRALLDGKACEGQIESCVEESLSDGWPLAYALSWIRVAGESSVMPPWVRHEFQAAVHLVNRLRDTPCASDACAWCGERRDPRKLLKRRFGFDGFRPEPAAEDGTPLQEVIAAAALEKTPVLGILPTGTGKSVCYQLPALAQFERTGALTVVLSPLVALMADQVAGMQGIGPCVTVNGLLSLPERHDALDRVRLGDAAILLISPEQLRSPSVRSVLDQREIGYWVIDEAHCISKWGHDFRPDYRYAARFIKERAGKAEPPPIVCLTATAKPGVVQDMLDHVRERLGIEMRLENGGAVRDNLEFSVVATTAGEKFLQLAEIIEDALPRDGEDGAIVYCSTRKATEDVSDFLQGRGIDADHYHAGLTPERKKDVQSRFGSGDLRVVVATNAFGMGIDKPDVRLVVHADIPGSLENYVQEAGRAGRDRAPARCVLMYDKGDVERQFRLSGRSRLSRVEIGAILKALRRLDRRTRDRDAIVATSGEIVREETDNAFERDSATDDTRVRTAVSWLEEAKLLRRDQNSVQVFPSSLRVKKIKDADRLIAAAPGAAPDYKRRLRDLVLALMNAPPDKGVSTDELAGASGFSPPQLRKALNDIETLGIASNDTAITIFVHVGVEDSSRKRLERTDGLERGLVDMLRERDPDLAPAEGTQIDLRIAAQELRDAGHEEARPDIVDRLVRSIAGDGRDGGEGVGSLRVRKLDRERVALRLQRGWDNLARTAELRRAAAAVILDALHAAAPRGARGKDVQVETTMGTLSAALADDLELDGETKDRSKLLDRALLWLHELGVVTLGRGLTVFRPAMTITLDPDGGQFTTADYEQLREFYDEQTVQTHIMAEYAERGLESMDKASRLSRDYFELDEEAFVDKWLADAKGALKRRTTQDSWHEIVDSLGNRAQKEIVRDDREQTSVLVLAGPGSGKTRVLVHRIAYLVRARREDPRGILALVYNRHAATEIRRRLLDLIGDDARGVTVLTCHGFAMRVVGASFAGRAENAEGSAFDEVLADAAALLRGDGLARDEAEAQRETLTSGYRWILVDEYQDVGPGEYELIAAIAGRSMSEEDGRLSLFAVGDDDQNVYAFKGASVEFIRRFGEDYRARPSRLVENYRSTGNIVTAANAVIAPAAKRMKAGHDIVVNATRADDPPGGALEGLDPLGGGRVQVLGPAGDMRRQAVLAVDELERLAGLVPDWDWARAAVVACEWKYLDPVRSLCEARGIPVRTANEDALGLWRLRETQALATWLRGRKARAVSPKKIAEWVSRQAASPWRDDLAAAVRDYVDERGERDADRESFLEWLAEWGRDARLRQDGLLLLTAHRAKGLEFDDVVVLDGGWDRRPRKGSPEDPDAPRRLFYVAMTRARRSLALVRLEDRHCVLANRRRGSDDGAFLARSPPGELDASDCGMIYRTLGLRDVDLGFAGRLGASNPSLGAIGRLKVGDPLFLERGEKGAYVLDREGGTRVGRLAGGCKLPSGARFVRGSVRAIVAWKKDDAAKQEHRGMAKRDEWETVVPELVFEAGA